MVQKQSSKKKNKKKMTATTDRGRRKHRSREPRGNVGSRVIFFLFSFFERFRPRSWLRALGFPRVVCAARFFFIRISSIYSLKKKHQTHALKHKEERKRA
jgi:hypothetical protein